MAISYYVGLLVAFALHAIIGRPGARTSQGG